MRVSLSTQEKSAVPKLHLHNSANRLNSYIKSNHQLVRKQEKLEEDKNEKLLEGLGKKVEVVKKEVIVKNREHADTKLLRLILKMIPMTPINTHDFSKILKTSDRLTKDGCQFLRELNLIHSSGVNRYKSNGNSNGNS